MLDLLKRSEKGSALTAADHDTNFTNIETEVNGKAEATHAADHTNGTDDIQNATAAQKGLMTAAFASKLDGIEASADVTDEANVTAALPVSDATSIVSDPGDSTKQMRFDVGAVSTSTVRVITVPDQDVDLTPASGTFASAAQGALADSATQPGDAVTTLDGTAHRLLYIDLNGDVVELAFGTSGQVLKSNGASSAPSFENEAGGAAELADLSDVDASVGTPSDGDILVFRNAGSDWVLETKPAGGSNPALNDVTDVTITSVADNEVLAFDTGSGEWINQTAAEAGLAAASHTHAGADITAGDIRARELYLGQGSVPAPSAGISTLTVNDDLTWYTSSDGSTTAVKINDPAAERIVIIANVTGGAIDIQKQDGTVIRSALPHRHAQLLTYEGSSTWTIAQPIALSDHSQPASTINSGTFADARIAQSNVTQHQAAIDHDALTNFAADEHVAHSGVALTAGEGLTGGGDITVGRTFDLDVNGLTADATPDGAADYVVTWDASATAHKKVLLNDLPGGGSGDVSKVGTPVDNEIGVWTGDGTIEGDTNFQWDGAKLTIAAGSIFVGERADAQADVAGQGQIWVNTATPNQLFFTDDAGNDREVAYAGGAFHDGLSDFVADEHVAHSGVTLTAGTGLTGGGTIAASRTFNVDVGIADTKILQVDATAGAPADDEFARFTATGIEGRTTAETKSDLAIALADISDSGTAAAEDVGTTVGDVVQLENVGGSPGMPAVDGSQLTGVAAADNYDHVEDGTDRSSTAFSVGVDGALQNEERRFTNTTGTQGINFATTDLAADSYGAFDIASSVTAEITGASDVTINGLADRGGANPAIGVRGMVYWRRTGAKTYLVSGETNEDRDVDGLTYTGAATYSGAQTFNGGITLGGEAALVDNVLSRPEIKDYAETANGLGNSTGTTDINLTAGNVVTATLTGDVTFTFSNPPASGKAGSFLLIATQDGTGGHSITWPGSVDWPGGTAPTISTGANAVDAFSFVTTDGGTTWLGFEGGIGFA